MKNIPVLLSAAIGLLLPVFEASAQVRVKVAPLDEIAIVVARSVPATVVSLRTAVVASQLSAQVTKMSLVPGDLVKKDDVIAALDCSDSTLALESARSQIEALKARQILARQQLARLNQLKQSRNASEEQVNQRQAELDVVTAEISTQSIAIRAAEIKVQRCEIKAPFTGLITALPGQVGNYLTPGSPVASVIDIDSIELKSSLLESQVDELNSNQPVFEFSGKTWPVSIRTIFPVIDETTQTREVRFTFAEDKPAPGSIGRLRWQLSGNTIPATYLVKRNNQNGIFVVTNDSANRAEFLPIPGSAAGQPATVDLPTDLLVVTDGRFGLQHGQEIVIE